MKNPRTMTMHSILVLVVAVGAGCVSEKATGRFERNVFYNAHYGSKDRPGIIVPRAIARIEEDYMGLGFEIRF